MPKLWQLSILCMLTVLPLSGSAVDLAGKGRITPISSTELAELIAAQSGKVVLVNFWASWCAPCLKEIPSLVQLEQRFGSRGFVLIPVSLDDPGDLEVTVVPFLNKWFPDFVSYARLDHDMDTVVSVIDPVWAEILPSSYVIDREGMVVEQLQGGKTIEDFADAVGPLLD
jgi:thiol-disulfide isomerase/thioredoxin